MERITEEQDRAGEASPIDRRFIPLRPGVIEAAIREDPASFGDVAERVSALRSAIDRAVAGWLSSVHRELDELYASLNADEETIVERLEGEAAERAEAELLRRFAWVLDKANFGRLGEREIEEAIEAGTTYGVRVRVDPGVVEHLSLHVRGRGEETVRRRSRWKPWRFVESTAPVYRRLVVVARLSGEVGVRIKLFRDIPVRDVEALLPHAEVEMTWFDRVQVFGCGAGALGGAAPKVYSAATGSLVSLFTLASALTVGFGGLAFRSFMGYRRAKSKRTSMRTRHLYDRKLANNAAVIHVLLRMIRQEEVKEALVAYALLARGGGEISGARALRDEAAGWLGARCGCEVGFDADDALRTLGRLGLLAEGESARVVGVDRALEVLAERSGSQWAVSDARSEPRR